MFERIARSLISRNSFRLLQDSVGLVSLSIRRDLTNITFVCDILNNVVNCPEILNDRIQNTRNRKSIVLYN